MLAVEAIMNRQSWTGKWAPTITTKDAGSEAMFEKVSFEGLAEVFLADQIAAEHLEPYFNGRPVLHISYEVICAYVLNRIQQGAGADQVDGELLTLKRMFENAMAAVPPMVVHAPRIPLPDEVEAMRRAWLRSGQDNGKM
ncbi:MAG: hypothetical protein KQJ78_15870 [Deltaproteobacteria bacterium]|nr:hypothetical protein [Deltaproteobacteria bacterium]